MVVISHAQHILDYASGRAMYEDLTFVDSEMLQLREQVDLFLLIDPV